MAMMEAYVIDLQQQVRHTPPKKDLTKPRKKCMPVDSSSPHNIVSPVAPKSVGKQKGYSNWSLSKSCRVGSHFNLGVGLVKSCLLCTCSNPFLSILLESVGSTSNTTALNGNRTYHPMHRQ